MTDPESLFARLQSDKSRKRPPISTWNPSQRGNSGMRIAADGRWFHLGSEIRRPEMVRLFSTILRRDGEHTFLVTPAEQLSIEVDDAPFVAIDVEARGVGTAQCLVFLTNVDDIVEADAAHAVRLIGTPPHVRPYVLVRDGLEALISRPVYYRLAELTTTGPGGNAGLWSNGVFFDWGRA
jgi:hypothetical protein